MSTDADELKARLKKLNARATQAKMDLHDLSEDLPTNWEKILEVSQRCHEVHAALMDARKEAAAAAG
ncbi:CCE_0567 family metalloprotein [Polaromonas hydrogenivorans]|uniref:CCE_0567 family metalloprotein n=1 Tax=Polaromonas hydrogenivorans TaxID=335476 RepID=A0AAU7LW99_9BURK